MLAEVVLTPSESKRLIGKAVASTEVVKEALKSGLIVIIKGTTNSYVAEEILKETIEKERYGRGIIVPGMLSYLPDEESIPDIIIEKGKVRKDLSLEEAVKMLKTGDVLIKGANALDPDGITGVFLARAPTTDGGTIGRSLGTVVGRGVKFIIPVSLEKLIPVPIREVVTQLNDKEINLAMGLTVNVMPTMGKVVTEIEAFKILTGVEAVNIGAGGVGGAEGARVFLLKGDEEAVKKAFNLVQSIKGEPPFKPASYWHE
ncbi:MAG: hypothetical protein AOA66_1485 [Candidatus Bathyarchaeota archaeon BA2]|nr:MAG: hypothetical protein AOA66_1485 [Candidatus Bathyarchaeota archaeon BA2]